MVHVERDYTNTELGSLNRVSVGREYTGKCSIKRCKCKKVVFIFVDDGTPKMSRLFGSYCRKHLPKAIKDGWKYNDKKWNKKHICEKLRVEKSDK